MTLTSYVRTFELSVFNESHSLRMDILKTP